MPQFDTWARARDTLESKELSLGDTKYTVISGDVPFTGGGRDQLVLYNENERKALVSDVLDNVSVDYSAIFRNQSITPEQVKKTDFEYMNKRCEFASEHSLTAVLDKIYRQAFPETD